MSFDKGSMNFTVVDLASYDRDKFLENLNGESYSASNPSFDAPVTDVTCGISLASTDKDGVSVDDFVLGGLPFFAVRKRELKIDASTVKETVERRILDLTKSGVDVSSKKKKEIKEDVIDALSVDASEKLSGVRCVISSTGKFMLVDATSGKKVEDFIDNIYSFVAMDAFGGSGGLVARSPEAMYSRTSGKGFMDYEQIEMNHFGTEAGIGEDFLTYLFMASEIENFFSDGTEVVLAGDIELADSRETSVGAKKIVVKEGVPSVAQEVVTALCSGKKVSSVDLMMSFGGDVYTVTVDSEFRFKKLTIKDEEKIGDIHARLESRMLSVSMFLDGFGKIFNKFVESEDSNEKMIQVWLDEKANLTKG